MKNLRRVLGLALFLPTILEASAGAQTGDPDEALVQDARQYAAAYDVDLDEAARRLRLQATIGELSAELSAKERATFGGIWIQHEPSYLVVAQFTPKGGRNLQDYLRSEARAELAPVIDQRTVRHSLRRLHQIQVAANRAVRRQGVAADTQINLQENRVELYTVEPAGAIEAMHAESRASGEAAALELPANVVVIGVDRLAVPKAYVYAGRQITDCTSGFAVQSSGGTLGLSTAGHCPDVTFYEGHSLPLQAQQFSGSVDAQWHTAPGLHVTNRAWDGIVDSTPNYRFITATKERAQQVPGEWVCKFGMTTFYTCGTINTTSYAPSYVPGVNATYVRVTGGTQEQSVGGDSGGPWFSGNTAYGLMSGGFLGSGGAANDAIYTPIDYLAPLGVSVLTTTPDIQVGRWSYRNAGNNISHYTGIDAAEYDCSVAGFAAIDGDINEGGSGDIIQTYLYKVDNHWVFRGDFRAHNNQESWDFDLLCLKKASYPVSRFEWKNLGGNINYNTGLSTTTYDCGIAGMAARDGDIDEGGSANIIQSYMYRSSGTWRIRADFHSHNNGESWDIDAMCVQKWAPVFKYEFANVGNNVNYNTGVSSSAYVCGVAGIAAIDGDINENGSGNIIQAYLYENGGTWWFRGDFHSHNNGESWNFDMLCIQP